MPVMVKYILVSGGVVSGVGKGLIASSVGVLLKSCGWNVTAVGLDPYLNVDAGVAARLIVPCRWFGCQIAFVYWTLYLLIQTDLSF